MLTTVPRLNPFFTKENQFGKKIMYGPAANLQVYSPDVVFEI
jgi:hypothetical protein